MRKGGRGVIQDPLQDKDRVEGTTHRKGGVPRVKGGKEEGVLFIPLAQLTHTYTREQQGMG